MTHQLIGPQSLLQMVGTEWRHPKYTSETRDAWSTLLQRYGTTQLATRLAMTNVLVDTFSMRRHIASGKVTALIAVGYIKVIKRCGRRNG